MPIEYKTYGCAFRCGQKHTENLKHIQNHELTCWSNPANKTCWTCSNQIANTIHEYHDELPGNPKEVFFERGCHHPVGEIIIEKNIDKLTMESGWIKPVVGCNYWNIEVTQDLIDFYKANDLSIKPCK